MTNHAAARARPSLLKSAAAFVLFVLVWWAVGAVTGIVAQAFYGIVGPFKGWGLLLVSATVSAFVSVHFALEALDRWMRNIYHRAVVRTFSVLVILWGLAMLALVLSEDYSAKVVLAKAFGMVLTGIVAWTFEGERGWH